MIKNIYKKAGKFLLIFIGIITSLIIVFFITFLILSPGKVSSTWLKENGIAEKIFMNIGGLQQGMIIESKNIENPVLLILHGGPGSTEYAAFKHYNVGLENLFTVCYWEQRGAGISYNPDIDENTMNLSQFISDTVDVTNYLRERFNKNKIYLLGHSWGTLLGSYVINQNPDLFNAYIGVGQMVNTVESEKEIWEFMYSNAIERGDKKAIIELGNNNPNNNNFIHDAQYMGLRMKYVLKYGGGITHNANSIMPFIWQIVKCKAYSIREKVNFIQGQIFSTMLLFREEATNNPNLLIDLAIQNIPVYIIAGKYDYQTTANQAKKYFDTLEAPTKMFFLFENSAHSPMFEEKELFLNIIQNDILFELN